MSHSHDSEFADPPSVMGYDAEESCVGLFIGGGRNEETLARRLRESFEVVRLDAEDFEDAEFDLCVVDTPRFVEHHAMLTARKKAAEPVVLPYLLVTRRDVDDVAPRVWTQVDDVITAPLEVAELRARIASLLKQRQLSLQVRHQRRLEEVASVISHDLRSPLEVAKGNVKLARETNDIEYFDVVERSLDRIDDLVSDVLLLARGGIDDLSVTTVSLAAVVRDCWTTTETGDSTLDLAVEEGTRIYADERRLRQVFSNLFGNATTHNEGPVTVRVAPLTDGFCVEDDGTGFPDHVGRDVLDTGVTTSDEGTGLGLSIVRRTADAHGWTLSVTESEAGGARFEFTDVTGAEEVPDGETDAATGTEEPEEGE